MTARRTVDVAIAGGGPAGLVAALALAHLGLPVLVVGHPPPSTAGPETRTIAIFGGGITLLERLGVWPLVARHSAEIRAIRLIDDTGRLFRAPEAQFGAAEIGRAVFGWNVPLIALGRALRVRAEETGGIELRDTRGIVAAAAGGSEVVLTLAEGDEIAARLVGAADGRRSLVREAAGLAVERWDYDQAAISATFAHSRPHAGVSTELHRPAGPLCTVPLPAGRSSLVWVETRAEAARIAALDDGAFCDLLEERLHGTLGRITAPGPRAAVPLSGLIAREFAGRRVALLGEAGHVFPPIGAQGLNLGLRDAAALAEAAADAVGSGADPGSDATLAVFAAGRKRDVRSRTYAVDALNRTLISDLLPAQMLRGAGLHLLTALGPLRHRLMRAGVGPEADLPQLMRAG